MSLDEAFLQWTKRCAITIQYMPPGKPEQNACIAPFNRTFREEVLDPHLFARLNDGYEAIREWMLAYGEQRPTEQSDSP